MKRVFVLLALLIIFTCFLCTSIAEEKIMFRDIPWGSDAATVKKALKKDGIDVSLYDDPSIVGVQYTKQIISEQYGFAVGEAGVTNISIDYTPNIKVAGYEPYIVSLMFVYRPENGRLIYQDKYAALYSGVYNFKAERVSKMFDDLKAKLESVYGRCKYEGGIETVEQIFGKSSYFVLTTTPTESFAIWESESAYLALVGCDYADDSGSSFYGDYIKIVYASKNGDNWINEAIEARNNKNADIESEKYGNGDTNGL